MRIIHLSDLHLRGDGGLSFQLVDTRVWLETAVAHFAQRVQKPDAYVITGDLADNGDEHAYQMLHAAFASLNTPVYAIPGNHDRRDRMRHILGSWCPENAEVMPYICSVVELEAAKNKTSPCTQRETGNHVCMTPRMIMLDSMEPGSHSGHFPDCVGDWLERELARKIGVPTLLFMHHPPFCTGMGMMDEPFEGVERFASILRKAPWVRLCCGHMHRPIVTQWAGCLAMTAPSVSMQIDLDLSPEGGDTFRMETPGYLLHHWEKGEWNSHVCQIPCQPSFSGPHRFIGSVNPVEE